MKNVVIALAMLLTQAPPSDLDRTLARMDEYLADYEPKLSELIADETMSQEMSGAAMAIFRQHSPSVPNERRRRLESEVAFIALPENAGWLGFRHVKSVNGKPIADAERSLGTALARSSYEAASELLSGSAAHNLGLPRTTNLPNLPLEFLHQRNRKRLLARLDGTERIGGVSTTRIVLIERMTPTLIRNPNGQDMPSVIRAWVDPRGALRRAEVTTFASFRAMEESENTIRVEFAEHKALGLLVPVEMRERFPIAVEYRGSSVAKYANFRRFQTSARIVPQ
jgi:hypothetical protein